MAQRILALDIGTSSIKLGEFSQAKDGGLQLIRYGGQALGLEPHDEENRVAYVTATLKELLVSTGIKPGPVSLAVAGQSVFSRYIKLPPVDNDKVYQIVKYEAQQNVPFPMDEVVWDYQILAGGGDDEQLDCLLVAIKREIISDIADAVSDAGMEIDVVDVAPLAIFNAFKHNYPDGEGCSLILDMGSRTTDLIFIEGDRIYNRSVPVAGNSITQQIARELDMEFPDADEIKHQHAFVSFGGAYEEPNDETTKLVSKCVRSVMTRMHQEINRSINFYRGQQGGHAPTRIFLTGGTSVIPHLNSFLSEKLGLEVEYLNPFQEVTVGDSLPDEQISGEVHKLAELVGLGLRKQGNCSIEINLLPPAVATEKQIKKKQPIFLAAMACVVLALGAWAFHFHRLTGVYADQLVEVEREKAQLQGATDQIRYVSKDLDAVVGEMSTLVGIKAEQDEWVYILNDLRDSIPAGLWITSVKPEKPMVSAKGGRGADLTGMEFSDDEDGEAVGPEIASLVIEGLGYVDYAGVDNGAWVPEIEKALHAKASFTTNSIVVLAPKPNLESESTISFRINLALEEPVPYEFSKIQNTSRRR